MSGWILAGALPLALLAGFVRGITGFGGSMVFTAPMALLAGGRSAVVIALLLEAFAAMNMLPSALRSARARVVVPISVAACLTVPVGAYLLTALDPEVLRRFIAATVLVLAVFMLRGFRYTGPQRTTTATLLGGFSGVLVSATSVGAPPVILYLLSGPDSVATTRANLTLFIIVMSLAALAIYAWHGVLSWPDTLAALVLAPAFFAGAWLGSLVFPRIDEKRFRRIVLWFLIAMSVTLIIA